MREGFGVRKSPTLLDLRLGDRLIQTFEEGEVGAVQSAVALLRTVFEDHHVDPEHQSCLFFHGCTLRGSGVRSHDFSVVHRGDRVVLSDFTFQVDGPAYVSLPRVRYAAQILRFARQVLASGTPPYRGPEWQQRYLESQREQLQSLIRLTQRLVDSDGEGYEELCQEFHSLHGHLKRPLELQVLEVLGPVEPRKPVLARCRVAFGPLSAGEVVPMRLNLGDVVLVSVNHFTHTGAILVLEGVGSGGVRPGDRLFGLQLFYP